jgi:triacylglycerol lipase
MSPRRRLLLALVAGAVVVVLAVVVGTVLAARGPAGAPDSRPAQDALGPVLLVPGYGGSQESLAPLARRLRAAGRDARVLALVGDGRGDLSAQVVALDAAVDAALAAGAPSVDLVGYSAGGVVVRVYVAELGGGSTVRRAVSLASPQHGTDLAALAGALGSQACPTACQQLDPDSDLLRRLNAGDESPPGPAWVSVWTEDDATVVPPDSGALDGALDFSVQSVCPGLHVEHPDVPRIALAPRDAGCAEAPRTSRSRPWS